MAAAAPAAVEGPGRHERPAQSGPTYPFIAGMMNYLGGVNAHTLPVPIVRFNEFLADTQRIGQGVVVGASGWETVLENNKSAFTAEFVQRTRFTGAYPTTLSPSSFVDQLFTNAGVTPTTSERNAAIAEFGSALDTNDVTARGRALRRLPPEKISDWVTGVPLAFIIEMGGKRIFINSGGRPNDVVSTNGRSVDLAILALLPLALTVLATWVARTAVLRSLRKAL